MSKENDFTTKIIIVVFLVLVLIVSGFFVLQMISDNGDEVESDSAETTEQTNTQTDSNQSNEVTNPTESSDNDASGTSQLNPQADTGDTRCLITVNGQTYDVTDFRNQHSGGDIFDCGDDMTATFNGEHGMDYERIRPYLVE